MHYLLLLAGACVVRSSLSVSHFAALSINMLTFGFVDQMIVTLLLQSKGYT